MGISTTHRALFQGLMHSAVLSAVREQGIPGTVGSRHLLALASIGTHIATGIIASFAVPFSGTKTMLNIMTACGAGANFISVSQGKYTRAILQSIFQTAMTVFITRSILSRVRPCDAFAPPIDSYALQGFLEKRKNELAEMARNKRPAPGWKTVGNGANKIVVEHPSLPGHLFKISKRDVSYWSFSHRQSSNDAVMEYKNQQDAKEMIERFSFKHLVVPDSQIVETEAGPVLVERKLELADRSNLPQGKEALAALVEYDALEDLGGFCDLNLLNEHNVGYLKNTGKEACLGLYDLDCRR